MEVGLRFAKRLRQSDTLARLGSDEFTVLLESPTDQEAAGRVAQDLLDLLKTPVALASGARIQVDASIGISLFPGQGMRYDELLNHADAALYCAKREGQHTFRFYSEARAAAPEQAYSKVAKFGHAANPFMRACVLG
jgi:diguanylate cyclase (GGDEF)-like protein